MTPFQRRVIFNAAIHHFKNPDSPIRQSNFGCPHVDLVAYVVSEQEGWEDLSDEARKLYADTFRPPHSKESCWLQAIPPTGCHKSGAINANADKLRIQCWKALAGGRKARILAARVAVEKAYAAYQSWYHETIWGTL